MKKDPNHWERYREIGFRIAYCRKYQKMTQEELAEKLNVSYNGSVVKTKI